MKNPVVARRISLLTLSLVARAVFAEDALPKTAEKFDVNGHTAYLYDDFEMTTPMIQKLLGSSTGTLKGKKAVGDYWKAALQKIPDLKFSIIDVTSGVNTVSVYYSAVLGLRAIETFFFDSDGKVFKAVATYNKGEP